MADGVAITAGSGTTIATDDAGASGHVQIVKLARSTDGSATPLTADADGLLVNLGTNNDVTVTGTVTATGAALESGGNLAAAATSLAIVDDWDESDRAKVNPIVGQAGVAAGAGAVSATVQRVTLASDDPAVALLGTIDADTGNLAGILTALQTLDNIVAGNEAQVDVLTLPAQSHGWKAYTASIASALTTELNALANGSASAASSAIDNTTSLDTHIDITVTLDTQGGARSTGASVTVYIIYALDGSNYDRTSGSTAELLVTLPYDAATTATQSTRTAIIRPGLFKLFAVNNTGQALAATGNLVEYRTYKRSAV